MLSETIGKAGFTYKWTPGVKKCIFEYCGVQRSRKESFTLKNKYLFTVWFICAVESLCRTPLGSRPK